MNKQEENIDFTRIELWYTSVCLLVCWHLLCSFYS